MERSRVQAAYPYTESLLKLSQRVPSVRRDVPQGLCKIQTPLVKAEWAKELSNHPDQKYAQYLLQGITEGFRVGFRYGDSVCRSAESNMQSAQQNPEVVDSYLAKEVQLGRVVAPDPQTAIHINRFGAIPKPHQPGKWRLILDLSYPRGASVNDSIERESGVH
jgi:hypothetical protein